MYCISIVDRCYGQRYKGRKFEIVFSMWIKIAHKSNKLPNYLLTVLLAFADHKTSVDKRA
jgi:hypothetical protein